MGIKKFIPGFENMILIDIFGEIENVTKPLSNQKVKKHIGTHGYLYFDIHKNKKRTRFNVHRILAQMFIDNPENKPCVNHIDGNKLNNNIDNLEWCTYSENNKHAYANALKIPYNRMGCNNPKSKLHPIHITYIREMIKMNISLVKIKNITSISKSVLWRIKKGKSYCDS